MTSSATRSHRCHIRRTRRYSSLSSRPPTSELHETEMVVKFGNRAERNPATKKGSSISEGPQAGILSPHGRSSKWARDREVSSASPIGVRSGQCPTRGTSPASESQGSLCRCWAAAVIPSSKRVRFGQESAMSCRIRSLMSKMHAVSSSRTRRQ